MMFSLCTKVWLECHSVVTTAENRALQKSSTVFNAFVVYCAPHKVQYAWAMMRSFCRFHGSNHRLNSYFPAERTDIDGLYLSIVKSFQCSPQFEARVRCRRILQMPQSSLSYWLDTMWQAPNCSATALTSISSILAVYPSSMHTDKSQWTTKL